MNIDAISANAQVQQAQKENNVSKDGFDKLLEEAKKTGDTTALRDATDQLEAVFIQMMMKTMRNSIPESEGIFKKSEAEKMFSEMLDDEYAKKMSEAGGIGISDMLFDQFEKYIDRDDEQVSSFELKG